MADARRMRAALIARELLTPITSAGERHVRTPAGARVYGQPIGSVITKDVVPNVGRVAKGMLNGKNGSAPKSAPAEKAHIPAPRSGQVKAYPNAARTPDGRVILSPKQVADFDPATGPHSMLAHVQEVTVNGEKVMALSKEREALHDRLVQQVVAGVKPRGGKPNKIFIGGGTGAGKSTATKQMPGYPKTRELHETDKPPGDAVLVDVDALKLALPEWGQPDLKGAASFAHEESSMLGKIVDERAMDLGLDIVLDGTGDSGAKKMAAKVDEALARGYGTSGLYVTVPAGEAIVRSLERGVESGRHVPLNTLMNIHQSVSVTAEGMSDKYGRFDLFDTDVPFGSPAIPIVSDGKIVDQERYTAFIEKKNVTHLQAAQEALRRAEAKQYRKITEPGGKVWTPEEIKAYTIENIQALIAKYSQAAASA